MNPATATPDPVETLLDEWAGNIDLKISLLSRAAHQVAAKAGVHPLGQEGLKSRDGRVEKLATIASRMPAPTIPSAITTVLAWAEHGRATTDAAILHGIPTLMVTSNGRARWVIAVPTRSGCVHYWMPDGEVHERDAVWATAARRINRQPAHVAAGATSFAMLHATHIALSTCFLANPPKLTPLLNRFGLSQESTHVLLAPSGGFTVGTPGAIRALTSRADIPMARIPLANIPPLPRSGAAAT